MDEISQDNHGPNPGIDARVAAARVLNQVLQQRYTLDDSLGRVCTKMRLNDADRRLVHAICAAVFRNLKNIDAFLQQVMNRKKDPNPVMLHHLLRVGVAQLLYLEIAEHAAVHSTVSAAGSLHLSKQKGLINAVLRSVQRQAQSLLCNATHAFEALPDWLKSRWIAHYGESDAQALATVLRQEAPLDLSIKDAHASLEWAQKLGGEVTLPGSVRVHQSAGQLASWPGFEDGSWWVQDVAAMLPINMLGDVAGKSVLDVCAAPGGKTMQLASRGAKVTALDVAPSRMMRLTENVSRLKLTDAVETVVADAFTWNTDQRFNVIVLDAPCTSSGTLRRHPELPWIHEEKDVSKMAVIQHDLLRRCADLLVHDGILLYCTCSLEVEEGENQLESFLNQRKDFKEITSIPAVVHPFVRRGARDLGFRTFPPLLADKGGMDGFFMALLQKQ